MNEDLMKIILFASIGSFHSDSCIRMAEQLATAYMARLKILVVIPFDTLGLDVANDVVDEATVARCEDALRKIKGELGDRGIRVDVGLRLGRPVEEIVQYAVENSAQNIMLGYKSKSLLSHYSAASIARKLLRRCPSCAVTLVANDRKEISVEI
jgi:nucleotide-binding universal stress UspA family protein